LNGFSSVTGIVSESILDLVRYNLKVYVAKAAASTGGTAAKASKVYEFVKTA
jgi:hypothetical protein